MVKKKLHHHVIHHGIHHALPFGAGTGIGITWFSGYLMEQISKLTGNSETIQACIDFIQSVSP